MMKKVLLIILFIGSLYGLSFSAERQTLVDGDGVELGTASNPLYVTGGSSSSDSKWEEVSGTLQPLTQSNNVSISNNLTVTTINYVNPTTGYTLDFVADKGQSTNQDLTISDSGAVSFTLHSTDSNSAALNFYRGTATDAYYDYRWKDDSGYMQFQKRGTDGIWVTEFEIIDETFDVHVRNDLTVDKSVSIGANLWVGGVKYTGGGLFTDGGAATYLTATDDDLALGGTTSEGSKFYMDVSEGDLSLNNSLTARGVLYGTELRTSGTGHGIIDSDTATLVINDSLNVQGDISGTGNLTAATAIFAPNEKLSNLQSQTGVTYFATVDATGELGKSATPFGAGSGTGGGLDNVVEDTSPQLGGELDCNAFGIMDATDVVDIKDGLSISDGLTVKGTTWFNQNDVKIDGVLTVTGKNYALPPNWMNIDLSISGSDITLYAGSELIANGKYYRIASDLSYSCQVFGDLSTSTYLWVDDSASSGSTPTLTTSGANYVPAWDSAKSGWYNGNDRCIGAFMTTGTITPGNLDSQITRYSGNRCAVLHKSYINNSSSLTCTTPTAPNRFAVASSTPVMADKVIMYIRGGDTDDYAGSFIIPSDLSGAGSLAPITNWWLGALCGAQSTSTDNNRIGMTIYVPLGRSRNILCVQQSDDDASQFYAYQTGYECSF